MDNLNIQISKGFGLKCKSMVKEKSGYICHTEFGEKVVRKGAGYPVDVEFQHKIKEGLYKRGFVTIDRYRETPDMKPYCFFDGDLYTMSEYYPYGEADFTSGMDILKIARAAGKLHKAGKSVAEEFVSGNAQTPPEIYQKAVKSLMAYKKKVLGKARMSDFDVIFIKNLEYYLKRLKRWLDFTEKTDCFNLDKNTVCHCNLKEENILLNKDSVYFIDFTSCKIENGVHDLAEIIRRFIRLSKSRNTSLTDIVAAYVSENPLSENEINALYAALLYPDSFLKICERFYSKKRTWTPASFTERLQKQINELEAYEKYIKGFNL